MNAKIKIPKEQRDRQYIKEELMRYYMYQDKCEELKQALLQYQQYYKDTLENPHIGGSIIKVSSNHPEYTNVVMRLESKKADLENNLIYYKAKIYELETWMHVLTFSQREVIMKYVCEYQCQKREKAANDLHCDSETVKKQTERGIERIRKHFPKIF